jgi:tetratricopeptide (TPR) repeat protein
VDRGVIATAEELFDARHYPSVVALATDALGHEPACVELLVLRARAHIALRRDGDAQTDLRDIIRHDPQRAIAYRLLGELAARRDENESAGIFFREAVRLDPGDREAREWLQIVDAAAQPRTRPSQPRAFVAIPGVYERPRAEPSQRTLSSPARRAPTEPGRLARGTQPPAEEVDERPTDRATVSPAQIQRTTKPLARGSEPTWKTPEPIRTIALPLPPPPALPATIIKRVEAPAMAGRPPPLPAKPAPVIPPRPVARNLTPELPGFGDYLVTAGILTRERLRAAQAYQRSMKVQLATAIVTLGLATPQRIEWAAVSHQSELAQGR